MDIFTKQQKLSTHVLKYTKTFAKIQVKTEKYKNKM